MARVSTGAGALQTAFTGFLRAVMTLLDVPGDAKHEEHNDLTQ